MEERIQGVVYRVGLKPHQFEMKNDLHEFQSVVGGLIEVVYLSGNLLLICHEEGRLIRLPENDRRIVRQEGIEERICGDFLICKRDGECFGSLSEREIKRLMELEENYYLIVRSDGMLFVGGGMFRIDLAKAKKYRFREQAERHCQTWNDYYIGQNSSRKCHVVTRDGEQVWPK